MPGNSAAVPAYVVTRREHPTTLAGALVLYASLVVALTWPLLPNAGSAFPDTSAPFHFDTLHTAWMLSHETRALTTDPANLLDARIYRPEPRTLFYSTTSLGLLPYFAPTFLLTGNPALALNLAFLLCVVLTAWAIHLVVWRWTGDHLAGGVGALSFLMSTTWRWGFVSAAPYFSTLQYTPLLIYAAATPRVVRSTLWLALPIAFQCLTDPVYMTAGVVIPLLLVALWRLVRSATRPTGVLLLGALGIAGLLLTPIAVGYLDVLARNPDLAAQSVWGAHAIDAEPRPGLLSVPQIVIFTVFAWWLRFNVPMITLVLVLAAAVARATWPSPATRDMRAAWRQCGLWFALTFLASEIHLPLLRGINRAGLLGLVALCTLGGLAWAELAIRLGASGGRPAARALAGVGLALLLVRPNGPVSPGHRPQSFAAYPIAPAPLHGSPILDALAASTGTVLELPTGTPQSDAEALYHSIFHHRPLVNGYSSYYPSSRAARLKTIRRLPNPIVLRRLRMDTGLTTIVVHTGALDPTTRAAWEPLLRGDAPNPELRRVIEDDGVVVLDYVPPPSVLERLRVAPPAAASTGASGRSDGAPP